MGLEPREDEVGEKGRENRERWRGGVARAMEASVVKRFYETNTVRHVLVFRRVCSYHGVYSFVFGCTNVHPLILAKLVDLCLIHT
jgi:hypothetical protein